MRKGIGYRYGLLVVLLLGIGALASTVPQEIPWSWHTPVAWGDFLGTPPSSAAQQAEAAAIHMTIRWSVSYTVTRDPQNDRWSGSVDPGSIQVTNTMQPHLSWAFSGKESAEVLRHEQAHFDLNEAYARRLTLALSAVCAQGGTADEAKATLNATINAAAARVLDALKVAQARYDAQTVHGTNRQAQDEWIERIASWLADPTAVPLVFG